MTPTRRRARPLPRRLSPDEARRVRIYQMRAVWLPIARTEIDREKEIVNGTPTSTR